MTMKMAMFVIDHSKRQIISLMSP